jgi:hypothetical protein
MPVTQGREPVKNLLKTLLILSLFPVSVFAQEPTNTAPCFWLYSVPITEDPDSPGDRRLSIGPYTEEIKARGLVHFIDFEVGGARTVTCFIGARLTPANTTALKDLLHSIAGATKIPESHARDLFSATWYQMGYDWDAMDLVIYDGRDGRELLTHPSTSKRLYELYDAARRWTTRCGTRLPLPAGC